jgi:hypothetical protein
MCRAWGAWARCGAGTPDPFGDVVAASFVLRLGKGALTVLGSDWSSASRSAAPVGATLWDALLRGSLLPTPRVPILPVLLYSVSGEESVPDSPTDDILQFVRGTVGWPTALFTAADRLTGPLGDALARYQV